MSHSSLVRVTDRLICSFGSATTDANVISIYMITLIAGSDLVFLGHLKLSFVELVFLNDGRFDNLQLVELLLFFHG